MDSETVESFAKYRLNKAKETLETAEMILKEGKDLTSANNRAYYAIFYAIRAVLAIEEIDFKRHKDVLAYFNKEYVNKGQQKLSRSGDQCAKSRTGNSHLRCSEFSKNEHIVRTQVDKERND